MVVVKRRKRVFGFGFFPGLLCLLSFSQRKLHVHCHSQFSSSCWSYTYTEKNIVTKVTIFVCFFDYVSNTGSPFHAWGGEVWSVVQKGSLLNAFTTLNCQCLNKSIREHGTGLPLVQVNYCNLSSHFHSVIKSKGRNKFLRQSLSAFLWNWFYSLCPTLPQLPLVKSVERQVTKLKPFLSSNILEHDLPTTDTYTSA